MIIIIKFSFVPWPTFLAPFSLLRPRQGFSSFKNVTRDSRKSYLHLLLEIAVYCLLRSFQGAICLPQGFCLKSITFNFFPSLPSKCYLFLSCPWHSTFSCSQWWDQATSFVQATGKSVIWLSCSSPPTQSAGYCPWSHVRCWLSILICPCEGTDQPGRGLSAPVKSALKAWCLPSVEDKVTIYFCETLT